MKVSEAEKSSLDIDTLKRNIFSDDWELVKSSIDQLGVLGNQKAVGYLISLLDLEDQDIRDRAALTLETIQDNRAVDPLLKSIFKEENHYLNGIMVFALKPLDCSKRLKEIFRILFYESYIAKMNAGEILRNQHFEFTKKDLNDISDMWEDCKKNPEICPGYDDDAIRIRIEEYVNSFLVYLKNWGANSTLFKNTTSIA